ncbi:hypothetical protein ACPWT1_00950 [Ramlibacter sp. MMS24-I3-19]|uniref:hypothetical protein n=1 Tax=Ramlibacter sp. MMS24-I3-19 TaxID=3416606 RepID=UPI003D04BB8C
METEVIELTLSEIDEVSGSGVLYWLGYGTGYAMAGASAFYADLPAGYALL